MESFVVIVVLVLVSLAMVNPEKPLQDNLTTLDGLFRQRHHQPLHQYSLHELRTTIGDQHEETDGFLTWNKTSHLETLTEKLLGYTVKLVTTVGLELTWDLENVTIKSVYDDLNGHCYEYLGKHIVDLNQYLTNTTCVETRLWEMVTMKAEQAIKITIQKMSRDCDQQQPALCTTVHRRCTRAYEERAEQYLANYIQFFKELVSLSGKTPLDILDSIVIINIVPLVKMFEDFQEFSHLVQFFKELANVNTPFAFENLLRPLTNTNIRESLTDQGNIISQDDLTWGIISSHTGTVRGICSLFREKYSVHSIDYIENLQFCYRMIIVQSNSELMLCDLKESPADILTWSTSPSLYFHSQCLCVASNGHNCGVKAPDGVNTLLYCLSVLLRDFQRQVAFRPAVTYLDYAFQTRVPVCLFADFLTSSFTSICPTDRFLENFYLAGSMQCYFNSLVNKDLNCSETLTIDPLNHTMVCGARFFMNFVLCEDDDGGDESRVSYYGAGDSTLVLFLTYSDVAVRVLTVVTYLACRQLRNLPGKLLISYLVTALVRLLVVRATLTDMVLAVRLDVATDLASTLWLSAYLHFLTVSISDLRPPNSLSCDEARIVLLRYSIFGWVLPAVLSAAFFWLDEANDSPVNIGQLLFLICNYVALFANIYMFWKNLKFYYDVKRSVRKIKKDVKKRTVMAALVNFAIKTSVLSGAGISFRLIFTQIQGLADLLGYYHAVGTIQGLLLFLLYGCNREARVFWLSVFRSTIRHYIPRHQNTSVRRNSFELVESPVTERL